MASRNDILAKLVVQITGDNAKLGPALNQANNQFKQFASTVKGVGAALGVAFGAQQIYSGIKAAIGVASEFEATMSEVKAITGATGKEFDSLSEDARKLGASTKFTANEVGQLQVAYGRLGFTTKEIKAATAATLDLAAATGEDLAKSADVAGSTVRGFGLDAEETQRVVDVMAASFNKTALGLENFTESMKYVAPIAAAANATVEETTALLGVLADAGIRGSTAGTSLRKIFTDLSKDGRPLKERLQELADKGITLADSFDEVGRTAQTSLLVLTKNLEKADQLTLAFGNVSGEAKKMALIMGDNLAGDVIKLTAAFEALFIKMSQNDAFRHVIRGLTELTNFIAGTGSSLDDRLDFFARVFELDPSDSKIKNITAELSELRRELGKDIEFPQIEFLIEKYKLTDEQAAKFKATIDEVNKSLSFQEKAMALFNQFASENGYTDLGKAAEDYKQKLYELILAEQIQREKYTSINFDNLFDAEIQGNNRRISEYQRFIEFLAEYQLKLDKKNKAEADSTKSTFESISSLEKRIKDLKEQMEAAPASNIPLLQNFKKEIDATELKLAKLLAKIAGVRAEIGGLNISSTEVADQIVSGTSSQGRLTGDISGATGSKLPQFSIPPVDGKEFLASLKNVSNSVGGFVSDIETQFIDMGGLISSALSSIAEEIGYQLAAALDPENVPTRDFGKAILGIIGQFAQQLGEIMIATGVGFQLLESGSAPAMIAGGVLLVAAGAALSAYAKQRKTLTKQIASGGGGSSGGFNGGSAGAVQNSALIEVADMQIKGSDLWIIFQNYERERGYTHGKS